MDKEKVLSRQGEGANYKPSTRINSFGSKGRCTRIFSPKTNRIHHLLSDNQLRFFLIVEDNPNVLDIRESFPLIDLNEVIDDKNDLAFDKFVNKETGEQMVMTTSFLLTIKEADGSKSYKARAVRNSSELEKKLTIEKYEIEKRYWTALGIEWRLVTDRDLSDYKQYCKNIQWFRETLIDNGECVEDKSKLVEELFYYLQNNRRIIIKEALKSFEKDFELQNGVGLYILRYLIALRKIKVDLKQEINIDLKIQDLVLF